ncbi:MAG: hypothetical protein OEW00_11975 [candidate division Zixibacteria bacterium]|nr:hypothetical protein [candidate division Zixibacteria bacterium]
MKSTTLPKCLLWAALPAFFVYGVYRSVAFSWIGDDAFISFRYARNLVDGHGLIFNLGERVEGYTNFLWTVLIALGMRLEIDPVDFSIALGIASYAITVIVFAYLSYRQFRFEFAGARFFVPVTALILLVHRDFQVWATGGLETSWVTMLIALGFATLVLAGRRTSFFVSGLLLVLAAMSRPDAMICYFAGAAAVLFMEKGERRSIVYYLMPLLIIYIPYWVIRYSYYGYAFPNTYYAKSANLTFFDQGLLYLLLYVKTYYILLLFPVAFLAAAWVLVKDSFRKRGVRGPVHRALLAGILIVVPFTLYILKTGGDFMFARFFIPITPIIFFFLEASLHILIRSSRTRLLLAAVVFLSVVFRWDQFPSGGVQYGIADESFYYPAEKIDDNRQTGLQLKKYLSGTEARVAYYGAHAMFVYYSEVPLAIESDAGLTDEYIAHLPLDHRGRVGHEKKAPMQYLYEREVNFWFKTTLPTRGAWDKVRQISFGDYEAYIFIYENEVMDKLKEHDGVSFVDFPDFLDNYIGRMADLDDSRVRRDYNFFKMYYFDHNDDREREKPFVERL